MQDCLCSIQCGSDKDPMDAPQEIFKHYDYIVRIIRIKAAQYGLDYDDCLNFVLHEISKEDHRKIRAFRGESQFSTFITVVVNRLIISYARKLRQVPESSAIISETPLDILIEQQEKQLKAKIFKKLPELLDELGMKERLILKMCYFKGIKISQISRELSLTRYEIKNFLDSGLDYLRNRIREISKK